MPCGSSNIYFNKVIKLTSAPEGFGDQPDELSESMFDSALPVQHTHSFFKCDELGLYIGVWDSTDMIEVAKPYECDEFMVVLEGTVNVKNNSTGINETVKAGESFIIPQGYDCQWQQQGYLRKFFVIYQPPSLKIPAKPVKEAIIKLNSPVSTFIGDIYNHNKFSVSVEKFQTIKRNELTYESYHFCYVYQGEIQIKDSDGLIQLFHQGDAFFIPVGATLRLNASKNIILHKVEIQV